MSGSVLFFFLNLSRLVFFLQGNCKWIYSLIQQNIKWVPVSASIGTTLNTGHNDKTLPSSNSKSRIKRLKNCLFQSTILLFKCFLQLSHKVLQPVSAYSQWQEAPPCSRQCWALENWFLPWSVISLPLYSTTWACVYPLTAHGATSLRIPSICWTMDRVSEPWNLAFQCCTDYTLMFSSKEYFNSTNNLMLIPFSV